MATLVEEREVGEVPMVSLHFYNQRHLVLFLVLLVLLSLNALTDPLAMPSGSELSPSLSDEPPVTVDRRV